MWTCQLQLTRLLGTEESLLSVVQFVLRWTSKATQATMAQISPRGNRAPFGREQWLQRNQMRREGEWKRDHIMDLQVVRTDDKRTTTLSCTPCFAHARRVPSPHGCLRSASPGLTPSHHARASALSRRRSLLA